MKYVLSAISAASMAGMAVAASGGTAHQHPASQHRYVGQELAPLAHVTMAQARVIALRAHPGTLTDAELEREAGGSGLRYSFDIRSHGKTFEVGVDAANGAVLENKTEGPHPD